MKNETIRSAAVAIGLSESVGFLGAICTMRSVEIWYRYLRKPPYTPPGWVFGPVWTLLYALMGIAASIVFRKQHKLRVFALTAFTVQLALNLLWSIIFFCARRPRAAFFELIALWFSIIISLVCFAAISIEAAALLIPYIIWTSYAAFLNYGIWQKNKHV